METISNEMRSKIIDLFEYRKLPELITLGGGAFDMAFYEKLIKLQYSIYLLDDVLETNWDVDMNLIAQRWAVIYNDLSALGISTELHDKFCSYIYKYQKHELEIRDGKLPTRLSMEYFYFYKSCDVKLLRKIIYKAFPSLNKVCTLSGWRLFDLITEINDDVTDVYEDMETINGNRFLIGSYVNGLQKTKDNFHAYIEELAERNKVQQPLVIGDFDVNQFIEGQLSMTQTLIDKIDLSKSEAIIAPYLSGVVTVG